MSRDTELDVLIVGGGIAGLTLSALLMNQGLNAKVLDRRTESAWTPTPEFDQRIYALNLGSVEILKAVGAWQRLDEARIGCMARIDVFGDDEAQLRFPSIDTPLAWIIEEGAVQTALEGALRQQYGERYRVVGEPKSLKVHPTHAEVMTTEGLSIQAKLVVGADGVHSWVRESQHWSVDTYDFDQTGVVMNIAVEDDHENIARQWFLDGDIIALLPLPDQRVSLVWSTTSDLAKTLTEAPPEMTLTALEKKIGRPLGAWTPLNRPAGFPLTQMTVSTLVGPRIALVGDAAHRVHPLAGQGLNLGLGDVMALSDTLKHRGIGPDVGDLSLLRRYARARALPLLLMRETTRGLHGLFASQHSTIRLIRNQGLQWVNRLPMIKGWLMSHAARSHSS